MGGDNVLCLGCSQDTQGQNLIVVALVSSLLTLLLTQGLPQIVALMIDMDVGGGAAATTIVE